MRLKQNEKARFRAQLLEDQGGICPLCEREIPSGQDTLDHDHKNGNIRMVLCRNCNSIEGRVLHWVSRTGVEAERWLANIAWYWQQDFSHNPEYPSHRNEIEKEIIVLKKKKNRVKRKKTKDKYQAKIDRLTKLARKQR